MSQQGNSESHFWPSYSDLMTSMFFIMLVMFVLTMVSLRFSLLEAEKLRRASEEQLEKIREIQEAVRQLPQQYFEEDTANKRWMIRSEYAPHFNIMSSDITLCNDTVSLLRVGSSLMDVVDRLNAMKADPKYSNMHISYLVVIEGMASNDSYVDNDALSYRRALSLYYLWRRNGISFEQSQCEVQVAGSGTRGIGRYNAGGRHPEQEVLNQRIIIQIVPKIGNIPKIGDI